MDFNTSVIELIKERRSSRTYKRKELPLELVNKINQLLSSYDIGPFGNKVSFNLIKKEFASGNHKVKIGTYGFISGAQYFIVGQVNNNAYCFEDYGYLLEKTILHLTDLKLGTCWLGGTFKRGIVSEILNLNENALIPAITPVGYIDISKTIRENIIRWAAKSDSRMHWKMLFFKDIFSNPLTKNEIKDYEIPIEMVRLAPSASNKQPWRIIQFNNNFHFYLKRTAGYKIFGNIDLQRVDMGIAMAHFELSCSESGLNGHWENHNPMIESAGFEYIVSWMVK